MHGLQSSRLRPHDAQVHTGRAAYNTTRALYVSSLPTLAHRVLHLLRRDGRQTQDRFVEVFGEKVLPQLGVTAKS